MNIKRIILICIIISTLYIDLSFAQDNISFAMSLTIPAIPGLNAPPYADEAKKTEPTEEEKQETAVAQNQVEVTAGEQTDNLQAGMQKENPE